MRNTLNNLILFLTDWLSSFKKTKSTSEVGSLGLTGNGSQKDNAPDWTTIIIFVIFGVLMWLAPSPIKYSDHYLPQPPVVLDGSHTVDTVNISYPVYMGKDTIKVVSSIDAPLYAEIITDKSEENAHIFIRTTAYPSIQDDSLHINMLQEYNITPKTIEIIKTDSIYVMKEVEVPAVVPFYEKPLFVSGVTVAIVGGILYIASQVGK